MNIVCQSLLLVPVCRALDALWPAPLFLRKNRKRTRAFAVVFKESGNKGVLLHGSVKDIKVVVINIGTSKINTGDFLFLDGWLGILEERWQRWDNTIRAIEVVDGKTRRWLDQRDVIGIAYVLGQRRWSRRLICLVKITSVRQPLKIVSYIQKAIDIRTLGIPGRYVLSVRPRWKDGNVSNSRRADFASGGLRDCARKVGWQSDRLCARLAGEFVDLNSVVRGMNRSWG
jgi:hypothetical protein